jgi:transposase-like protein
MITKGDTTMDPPFCPNPDCPYHTKALAKENWYHHHGTYHTRVVGTVQRFRCTLCGKSFSSRTFSIDYYTKRTLTYSTLMRLLASSMSTRALARFFSATTETIQNRIDRLARNILAYHESALPTIPLAEDMVADGFVSFTHSQYFPENITILVGKRSQFIYFFNHVTVPRSGRRTAQQKRIEKQLYKRAVFEPYGLTRRFRELLQRLAPLLARKETTQTTLYTDEKKEYLRALEQEPATLLPRLLELLIHIQIPSTQARTTTNPLFSVNYMDREFRKDLANHRRETTCFSRNVSASMMRFTVYSFYHNYCKPYRIDNYPAAQPLHAQVAGVAEQVVRQRVRVFSERAFLTLEQVRGSFRQMWKKELRTPLKEKKEYIPAYALG